MASSNPSGRPVTTGTINILCPHCKKPNQRTVDNLHRARFCQHCGQDIVLNNDGPRYYITRVIKEGGQGAVYEAIDDNLHIYAVKEMLDRFLDPKEREEAIDRFEAEAKMLQSFRHPRIPRVYADFKDEGRHYLVMDFVRGEDLEDIVKRDGKIAEAQVLIWADQICDMLELLHRQDPPIIFRDMKPSNVMIETASGGVKLIDFGIAKVFQPSQRGTQIGTPGYAPPEQYQGIADFTSDVYALGATLHHLLTGRDPRDHMPFTFPPVRSLNPAVSEQTANAVEKAVQKFASDRYQTIAEFRSALRPQPSRQRTIQLPPQSIPANQAQQPVSPAPAPPAQAPSVPVIPRQQSPSQPAVAARPATQAQPVPGNIAAQPIPQPAQPTQQGKQQAQKPATKRRLPVAGIIFAAIALVLIIATVIALPGIGTDLIPSTSPTATTQVLVQLTYMVDGLEIIVPSGVDVRQAFTEAFLQKAREQYGSSAIINQNAPPSFIGQLENLGDEGGGTKYRASMQGFILVPRQ